MNKKLFNVKNFVTIITGSAQGIGLEVAAAFYKCDAQVIRVDPNLQKHKFYKFDDYKIDLRKKKLVDQFLNKIKSKYGRIDVLINNAGIVKPQHNHSLYDGGGIYATGALLLSLLVLLY